MGVCLCQSCAKLQHVDEFGAIRPGTIQNATNIRLHATRDSLRQAASVHARPAGASTYQAATPIDSSPNATTTSAADDVSTSDFADNVSGNLILLATMADKAPQHSNSLPIRQRDIPQDEVDDRGETPPPCDVPAPESFWDFPPGDVTPDEEEPSPPWSSDESSSDEDVSGSSDESLKSDEESDIVDRLKELSALNSKLAHRSRMVPHYVKITFRSEPSSINDPPAELDTRFHGSAEVSILYDWLCLNIEYLRSLPLLGHREADGRLRGVLRQFERQFKRLERLREEAWEREKARVGLIYVEGLTDFPRPVLADLPKEKRAASDKPTFLLVGLLMITILHTLADVARPGAAFALASLKVILFGAFTWSMGSAALSGPQEALLKDIPADIRKVIKDLNLEPKVMEYATCPKCWAIYAPDPTKRHDPYPRRCTFAETNKQACGARLVRKDKQKPGRGEVQARIVYKAVCSYPYHSFKDWLTTLLSRVGLEGILEKSWDEPEEGQLAVDDIIRSSVLRSFVGPDGQTLYCVQTDGELHLVFSLFVDWFNPHGNKKAGKSHSIGAIYLACMNLPPHLRFRPENIYLAGVIPGPKEPSVHQLNHLLRPLVDELLVLWHCGLHTPTPGTVVGRIVRVAVIPLVCDLPALRKVAGYTSHGSRHFCSFCPLPKSDMSNPDRVSWPSGKSWEEHLEVAREWRDAETDAQRKNILDNHGLWWSELLRLEYWDPTRYALVDTMHNLFLGELRHHCMDIFGVATAEKGSRNAAWHTPEEQQEQLDRILTALKAGAKKTLERIRTDYISAFARYNNVLAGTAKPAKRHWIDAMQAWARTLPDFSSVRIPPVLDEETDNFRLPYDEVPRRSEYDVFTRDILNILRQDIAASSVPSWIEKPPAQFGSASHGKLKADQWRTVCIIHMVMTLGRIWGDASATDEERIVLDNFLELVMAVDLATRRSMSPSRIAAYDKHMDTYIKGLRTIFQHPLTPNHHLALHLWQCLELFGPVQGWWAFPFERYNGLMQQTRTNNKPNEMPLTFMRFFYIGSALRWLMSTAQWPADTVYTAMMSAYNEAFKDVTRGTRMTDILASPSSGPDDAPVYDEKKHQSLPQDIYHAVLRMIRTYSQVPFQSAYATGGARGISLPTSGQFVSSIIRAGLKYTSAQTSVRDSLITFVDPSTSAIRAGQIEEIFLHRRLENGSVVVEPFLIVRGYSPLSGQDVQHDPFRKYEDLNTKLYYNELEESTCVIHQQDISAHFAALVYTPPEIGRECIIVRSLDRS